MAISYPLTMPLTGVMRCRPTPEDAAGVQPSPFTLQSTVYVAGGDRWTLDVELRPLAHAESGAWVGFLTALRGPVGTFLAGDPTRRQPIGTAAGSPYVSGNGQTGYTLVTSGWTPNQARTLAAGDMIQIGLGAQARLYRIVQDAASDGGGAATLELWPRLRFAYTAGTTIYVRNTVGVWRLAGRFSHSISPGPVHSIAFQAIEGI